MRLRTALLTAFLGLAVWGALFAQNPFKQYPAFEYDDFPLPNGWDRKTEWTRARLRYPDLNGYSLTHKLFYQNGAEYAGYWTMDYPRSDRHLLEGIGRLTRIDTRPVEQVVAFDGTDDVFNWPTLYAVEVGHWVLPDDQVKQFREYLLRGGFFMCDDFHGTAPYRGIPEWDVFISSMNKVFPDRQIEDIPDNDPIFHTVYDVHERFQVPGALFFETGLTYEAGETGKTPHWRCIRDDHGRIMVAICHNMDLGDAWEHSDEARYQEKWASLAYRIAVNYFTYDLSH